MAHELSIVNGKAEMFSASGVVPWHGLGTVLPERVTSFEAILAAHLNWQVELFPVQALLKDGATVTAQGKKAAVRTDTNNVLGILGDRYRVLQNVEAFTFFDSVIGEGQAVYETAGALFSGKKVWILARLNGDMNIGKDDVVKRYLLFTNAHDGSQAVRMFFTPVRVVCNNTLTMAEGRRGGMGNMVSIRHTESMKDKVKTAQEVLGLAVERYGILEKSFQQFYVKNITEGQAEGFFKNVFDLDDEQKADKELKLDLLNFYHTDTTIGVKDTVWAAYNIATGYVDHTMTAIKTKSRRTLATRQSNHMASVCYGRGANIKAKALNQAFALCV